MAINKNIRVLLFGASIWYIAEGMLGPLFAVYTETIGGGILDITWAWAVYLIVAGILYIIVGKLTDDHKNKKGIMVLGYALNALCTFGYLLVTTPDQLFLVQAGLGVAAALATPTWNALYAGYEDKKHAGLEWGLADGTRQIITACAIIIGGYIVSYASFQTLFLIMGTIQVIATIYQTRILKTK